MAKIRNISGEDRRLPWLNDRVVPADETVEVPDEHWEAYVCQTGTWESVTEPKTPPPSAGEAAAKPASSGTAASSKATTAKGKGD